jgi:hypothetical protein
MPGAEGPPGELGTEKGGVEGDAGFMPNRRRRRRCGGIIGRRTRWGWSGGGSGGEGKKEDGAGREFGVGVGCVVQWFSGAVNVVL